MLNCYLKNQHIVFVINVWNKFATTDETLQLSHYSIKIFNLQKYLQNILTILSVLQSLSSLTLLIVDNLN